ncbi:hypothetical protein FA95DRAFT_1565404 [Auriscalpium vulgare]|uniref:Uncharacterized protein n=1 Tax=Auriscalpium vulgare TaxID=40419 RepID=A0ACB8RBT2_9AGAM|nr:hypothetical protein FA95DRAFT_1565404 [Auriscalpium vulgare]
MAQRVATARSDAFDANSNLGFNAVQEQMIASFPQSAHISGNIAGRRYSSVSSSYLSSASSQSPTTPTTNMPPSTQYGPGSVVSPTPAVPAAYNDWLIQIPSLEAAQHYGLEPNPYSAGGPSIPYPPHGAVAAMVNTYGSPVSPTSPGPSQVACMPADGAPRRRGTEEHRTRTL